MSKVVYLRTEAPVTEYYRIEQKGEQSWWVVCQPLAWDGSELPNSRMVKFANSQQEAQDWLDQRADRERPALRANG